MDSQVSFLLFSPLVWLTTASFGEPCSYTREESGGLWVLCGWPVAALGPNDVFVEWGFGGGASWSLDRMPGDPGRVGGRPARIARVDSGPLEDKCRSIGGDEAITVWISRAPHNYYSMIACLRGPDLQTREQQVFTMLRSARFPFG